MTITVVCDVLGAENNGTTIAAMNLINYLKSKGHNVRVLCADSDKKGLPDYYVVPKTDFGIFQTYVEKNGVSLAKPERDVVEAALSGIDVVHIMLPFSLGQSAARIAQKKKIPISAGFHLLAENISTHVFMTKSKLFNRATYAIFHQMYKRCDSIHYVTQYIRNIYEGMYGKTNGYVISNGVNEMFKPCPVPRENDYIRILYTGRYSKEKAHKTLISAVGYSKYKDKIQLVLAGDGPLKQTLEKQAQSLPVPPVFKFYSREEMLKVDNSADLYVHAAEYEAEGIGCLEALACGIVPVISDSEKSATKFYAIDEKSLFKCNDAKDLAAKIDYWLDNPDEKAKYSAKYAELSRKKFDHSACMKAMEDMLLKTASIKKS